MHLKTLQCDVCERVRKPRFEGQQWFEVYWDEMEDVMLHVCDGCRDITERLLLSLGFQVEIPNVVGPDRKAIDRITISGFYGAVDKTQMHPRLSKILREARKSSTNKGDFRDSFTKLVDMAEEQNLIVYNIHFCRAGVGVQWFDGKKCPAWEDSWPLDYKQGLVTYDYYGDLDAMVKGETERLKKDS